MLHVDIPTLPELRTLAAARGDICASLFLPTTPLTQDTAADRIALKNLVQGLVRELDAKGFDKRRVAALRSSWPTSSTTTSSGAFRHAASPCSRRRTACAPIGCRTG
jgi:hypothetical protein